MSGNFKRRLTPSPLLIIIALAGLKFWWKIRRTFTTKMKTSKKNIISPPLFVNFSLDSVFLWQAISAGNDHALDMRRTREYPFLFKALTRTAHKHLFWLFLRILWRAWHMNGWGASSCLEQFGKFNKTLFISEVGAWYTRDKYHPIHVQSEAHIQQICNGNDMIYW